MDLEIIFIIWYEISSFLQSTLHSFKSKLHEKNLIIDKWHFIFIKSITIKLMVDKTLTQQIIKKLANGSYRTQSFFFLEKCNQTIKLYHCIATSVSVKLNLYFIVRRHFIFSLIFVKLKHETNLLRWTMSNDIHNTPLGRTLYQIP